MPHTQLRRGFSTYFQPLTMVILLIFVFGVGAFASAQPRFGPTTFESGGVYCNFLIDGPDLTMKPEGPNLFLRNPFPTRNDYEIERLRIGSYNVFNLEWLKGKFVEDPATGQKVQVAPAMKKSPESLREIAGIILRENPDIMALQEVEDGQALEKFNSEYLQDKYIVLLIEGNDGRGIDVGFLIKKDLPFDIEVQSHKFVKDRYKSEPMNIFSRDLPIVTFWPKGSDRRGRPFFSFIGTHFKSQRDKKGDPRSEKLRTLQVKNAIQIINNLQQRHGENHVVMMAGDYNADLHTAPEFQQLWQAGFMDSLDLQANVPPRLARVSQTYHPNGGKTVFSQMDGILLAPTPLQQSLILSAGVIPYLMPDGSLRPLPNTYDERSLQPSDHRMVMAEILFRLIYDQ